MDDYERRAAERRKCYLSARLFLNGNTSSLDAVVRNISLLGARLDADDLSIVPSEFELLIHGGRAADTKHRARRIWVDSGHMGIAFDAAEALR